MGIEFAGGRAIVQFPDSGAIPKAWWPRVAFSLMLVTALSIGCAHHADVATVWTVEDGTGQGVELYDRPDGRIIDTLVSQGDPSVTPLGIRGDHWKVRTATGRDGWLTDTQFPVPRLTSSFATQHGVHVATAFPIAHVDATFAPLLAVMVDTQLGRSELYSPALERELESIWSLYEPFTRNVDRVSLTVLSADVDPNTKTDTSDAGLVGYARIFRRFCADRSGDTWGPLGACKTEVRLKRTPRFIGP